MKRTRSPQQVRRAAWEREFDAVKPIVAARSLGVCELRGEGCTRWAEHYHHKALRRHPAANLPEFIAHLCPSCHRRVHDQPAWSYANGWLLHYEEATFAASLVSSSGEVGGTRGVIPSPSPGEPGGSPDTLCEDCGREAVCDPYSPQEGRELALCADCCPECREGA